MLYKTTRGIPISATEVHKTLIRQEMCRIVADSDTTDMTQTVDQFRNKCVIVSISQTVSTATILSPTIHSTFTCDGKRTRVPNVYALDLCVLAIKSQLHWLF